MTAAEARAEISLSGSRSDSKKLKVLAQDLIEHFNKADKRSDFESIYNNRVNIKKLILFNEKVQKLNNKIFWKMKQT